MKNITSILIGTLLGATTTFTVLTQLPGDAVEKSSAGDVQVHYNPEETTQPGRMIPNGEVPTAADVARDALAARVVMERNAPAGAITIFGSARAKEGMASYDQTREFARKWTQRFGARHPILTGGSHGIMEAGNRGALEAGGKSLYISSYFRGGIENAVNQFVTDGYVAASFAQREADLVDYAAGVIVAPGGVGTSWEIFETLSKVQTRKKNPCPIILLGDEETWRPLLDYMDHLKTLGTISPEDTELLQVAATAEEAMALLEAELINEVATKLTLL